MYACVYIQHMWTTLKFFLSDQSYDFNYQIARRLKKELTVLPGDSLILECQYDSKGRTVPTFVSIGTLFSLSIVLDISNMLDRCVSKVLLHM